MSGRLKDTVFFRNQHQPIVARNYVVPNDPNTANQQKIRSAFLWASALWISTSEANREGWREYVDTLQSSKKPKSDILNPRDHFLGIGSLRRYLTLQGVTGQVFTADPPEIPGFIANGGVNISDTTSGQTGFRLDFTNPNTEDITYWMWLSAPQNATRLRWKGPWNPTTLIGRAVVPGGTNFYSFIGLIANNIYFIRIRITSQFTPFRQSAVYIYRAIATTAP